MEGPTSSSNSSYYYVITNSSISYCISQIDSKISCMESEYRRKGYDLDEMSKLPNTIEGDMQKEKILQKLFSRSQKINSLYNELIVYIGFLSNTISREQEEGRKKKLETWKNHYLRKAFKCLDKESLAATLVIPSPS